MICIMAYYGYTYLAVLNEVCMGFPVPGKGTTGSPPGPRPANAGFTPGVNNVLGGGAV